MIIWKASVLLLCVLSVCPESEQEILKNFNSPEALAACIQKYLASKDGDISKVCSTQFDEYKAGLRLGQQWALEMFDAGSKIPTGILSGNAGDLGNFDQCLNVEGSTSQGTIRGKYCLGRLAIRKQKDISQNVTIGFPAFEFSQYRRQLSLSLKLATCLPDACSAADIQKLYERCGINMKYSDDKCQTKESQPKLDGIAIGTIAFLGTIGVIMGISTIYDVYNYYTKKKPFHILLIAFSVFTNGKKLLATSTNPNQITCLHGIRTISMMWIILAHRFKTLFEVLLFNQKELKEWIESFTNSYMTGAAVSVDSFLLMSGLVISYSFMLAKERGVKFNVLILYLHRYLRLTPAYAAVILINVSLMKHLGSGPQWPGLVEEVLEKPCRKYWWSALLYVQNYVNPAETCMGQTWYLSVDTQLFLLSPLLLISFYKWPKMKPFVLGALVIASVLTTFFISWFEKLYEAVGIYEPEKWQEYVDKVYYPTHTRASPWLIGLGTGYIIHATKKSKFTFSFFGVQHHLINLVLWAASLAVLCACVLGSYNVVNGELNMLSQAAFTGFVGPAWSVALSCLILACVHGYGGPINWILSNPLMQVVSKFTYSMYLLHKMALSIYIYSARTCFIFSNFEVWHSFWGDFIFTLALAAFWVLAFESPVVTLEKVLFGRDDEKKSSAQTNSTSPQSNEKLEHVNNKLPV